MSDSGSGSLGTATQQGGQQVQNVWTNAPSTANNITQGSIDYFNSTGAVQSYALAGNPSANNVGQLFQQQHIPWKHRAYDNPAAAMQDHIIGGGNEGLTHPVINTVPVHGRDFPVIPNIIENNAIHNFGESVIYGSDYFSQPERTSPVSNFLSRLPMQGNLFMSEMSLDMGSHIVGDLSQPSRVRPREQWGTDITNSFTGSNHITQNPGVLFSGVNLSPIGAADILNLNDRRWF